MENNRFTRRFSQYHIVTQIAARPLAMVVYSGFAIYTGVDCRRSDSRLSVDG